MRPALTALLVSLVAAFPAIPAPATSGQAVDIETLVARVDNHYASVRDFEANFTQRYERRLLSRVVEESGVVQVKKPGRMRWEYTQPEEKLFVTDGTSSYFYLPAEKQVMVSHDPKGAMGLQEGSPFEILAGTARITDGFSFFASETQPTRGGVMLHAIPMTRHDEFEDVELEVRPEDGLILRVVLLDSQGNRTDFSFDEVRENLDLSDSNFRFTVPSGVEVVVQSDDAARGDRP